MTGPTGWNLNTHPELSDENYIITSLAVYWGVDPLTWLNYSTSVPGSYPQSNLGYAMSIVASSGRQGWISWIMANSQGNASDGWFYNVPTWAAMVIIPVTLVTAIVLAWYAWGDELKRRIPRSNGGSTDRL